MSNRNIKPRDYRHGNSSYRLVDVDGIWFVTIRLETYRPSNLRKLAAWLERAARFMEGGK